MKLSKMFLPTLREEPVDTDTVSAKLMIRSGMIRKLASGIYEWLPLGLKVLKKVEQIIREEMDSIGGQELWLPLLLPKELWLETGRWQLYGSELFRIKDRKESEFCLSPTHEEIITDIVRREVRSYRELPIMLYQFGIKFRDEIRPRFGVMRAREFYMKDAYSFHATEQDAEEYYNKVFESYMKICDRCGFKYRPVEATTGAIGGKFSHEFMVLAETGEEEIVVCKKCNYAANVEKAECVDIVPDTETERYEQKKIEEVYTPNLRSVEEVAKFLNEKEEKFIKTLIYISDSEPVMVLVRGDYEINETKLKTYLGCKELNLATSDIIEKITGAPVGFAGPIGIKQKIKIICDYSVKNIVNGISGANKKDFHIKNININVDYQPDAIVDLRKVTRNDICPKCITNGVKSKLEFYKGIEVGHTFKLGTKYSKSMNATFLNQEGKQQYFVMGCYGIGVSRIVAALIEQSHDEKGIIWSKTLTPYHVYIIPIDYNDKKIKEIADKIYNELIENGFDVLLDDRDERPGVKFKDADLIGIPVRIVVSSRNLPDNVEIKLRTNNEANIIKIANCLSEIKQYYKS